LLIRWAPRLGLIDLPGARKVHTQPTPRGGGLAIYAGLVVAALVLGRDHGAEFLLMLAPGFVIMVLGVVDDLRPLPWQLRIGVQFVTASVVIFGWHSNLGWPLQVAAVFWLVGLINAFNMLDNMDGLSAGVACI